MSRAHIYMNSSSNEKRNRNQNIKISHVINVLCVCVCVFLEIKLMSAGMLDTACPESSFSLTMCELGEKVS